MFLYLLRGRGEFSPVEADCRHGLKATGRLNLENAQKGLNQAEGRACRASRVSLCMSSAWVAKGMDFLRNSLAP